MLFSVLNCRIRRSFSS